MRNHKDLELLSRINQHNRLAGTLGILPNQLIQLIRLHDSKNLKKIINDLRLTTFWSTFNIWTKHQTLNRTYYKILPSCCKPEIKEKKTVPLGKKRKRRTKHLVLEAVKIPFTTFPWKRLRNPFMEHAVAVLCEHAVAKKTMISQKHCRIPIISNPTLSWTISHWTLLTIKMNYHTISLVLITSILRKIE